MLTLATRYFNTVLEVLITVLEVLIRAITQEKEKGSKFERKSKTDNMALYRKNPKDSSKKTIKAILKFIKLWIEKLYELHFYIHT